MKHLIEGTVVKVWLRPDTGQMLEGNARLLELKDPNKNLWTVQFITGGDIRERIINRMNA